MRYTWLLFDADGTLFDYDQAEASALQRTFDQYGLPWQANSLPLYHQINAQMWQALERGQITPAVLGTRRFELLFEALALPPLPAAFSASYLQHLAESAQLMEGAQALLQNLHVHYRLAILTNGLKAVQRPRLERSGLRPYIAELIISEEVGAAKPDPAIFDAALARMGWPARASVLMIGDSLTSDIRGALHSGLEACWYNPSGQPRPADIAPQYEIRALSQLQPLLRQIEHRPL